jgi:hypothetical protein
MQSVHIPVDDALRGTLPEASRNLRSGGPSRDICRHISASCKLAVNTPMFGDAPRVEKEMETFTMMLNGLAHAGLDRATMESLFTTAETFRNAGHDMDVTFAREQAAR